MSIEKCQPPSFERNRFDGRDVVVALFNQFGATSAGEGMRDASELARSLGVTVFSVDRPGTRVALPSWQMARRLRTPYGYAAAMRPIGEALTAAAEGRQIVAAGRSAGGLASLALAESRSTNNLRYVVSAEPPGSMPMSTRRAKQYYRSYKHRQSNILDNPADPLLVVPESHGLQWWPAAIRAMRFGHDMPIDSFHNGDIYSSNAVVEYVEDIAAAQPNVGVRVEYAADSMAADPDAYERIVHAAEVRSASGPNSAPCSVGRSEHTVHASYDRRSEMARLIGSYVEWTANNPASSAE